MDNAMMLAEVRSWIGTPWKHGVALKGWGADCIQWIAAFGMWLGKIPADCEFPKYHRDWALHNSRSVLIEQVSRFSDPLDATGVLSTGDTLIFTFGLTQSHAGIYTEDGKCVHAHIRHGVVEVKTDSIRRKINGNWVPAFDSAWRWRHV
jgi:NlpC/P60 family putative phage cell wall peptidase